MGRWRGPLPLEGTSACEIRLLGGGGATVQCDGTRVVGAGAYEWDGARLTIRLTALAYDGQKVRAPEPMRFEVRGEGNRLRLASPGERYEWTRTLP